ncbi:MAG: hypothetical protein NXI31_00650 [bacterium]|nr:hypothetical protein [bacterium]
MHHRNLSCGLLASSFVFATACQGLQVDNAWALRSSKLETSVDGDGAVTEIEYHIAPNLVPTAVRGAMSELYPDVTFERAEYEVRSGETLYELVTAVEGRSVNAMFHEDGRLHTLEVEIDPESEPAITRTVMRAWPGCTIEAVEQVRDGEQLIVGYHVDITSRERAIKVTVDRSGQVTAAVREIAAEVEVPIDLPQ